MATGGSDRDTEADDTVNKLTCAICLEKYRRPKLLPCFHTFCQSCLQGLAGSSPSLACPSCRSPVLLPAGGVRDLQTNFYIEEDLGSPTASSPQQRLCDVCTEDREATHTCLQCQQKFCLPCRNCHDTFKSCQSHTVVSLTPEDTDGRGKGAASPAKLMDESKQTCSKHPGQRLLLHCKQCQADICMQCKLTRHDGHPTDDLVDIQAEARTSLQDMLRDVTQQRRQIHHLVLALNDRCVKLEEQQQETERECQERADTLRQWVKQSLDDMVTSIQTTTKEMGKPLQDQVEQLKNKDLALQAQQDHLARALKEDRNTDIVSLEAQLSSSLLPSTDFKQIEKELAANIPKLHVKHSTSTVNQMQLREFVGVLQPVPPVSFPLQPSSVAVHTDSTDRKSLSKIRADVSQKKPPTEFQYSKNPQSSITAMCPISQNRLWVMYTPIENAAVLMKLFDADGQVLTTVKNARTCSGLITIPCDTVLSWNYYSSPQIQLIDSDGQLRNDNLESSVGLLMNNATNDNQYNRCTESNTLRQIRFLKSDKLTYAKINVFCESAPRRYCRGHVSSKGDFAVFVFDGEVQVFNEGSSQNSSPFSWYKPEKNVPIDARFCQVDGQEQLLVLVQDDNRVHVVDHTDGGAFVRYLDTGPLNLSGLQHLATNFDQHVWIGCKGGKVVMVDL